MNLERLSIGRCEWEYEGKIKGRYYGEAVFNSPLGKVQINLNPEASDAILKICAGQVMESTKAVAEAMTLNALAGISVPPVLTVSQ